MLNGDVLTDIGPEARKIAQHDADPGRRATLALVPVCRPEWPTAWCTLNEGPLGARFRREAEPGCDRHEPDQRPGAYVLQREVLQLVPRRSQRLDRARGCGRCWSAAGLYGFPLRELLAGHRAHPSATCRAPSTSSRATWQTAVGERLGGDWLAIDDGAEIAGRVIPPAVLERGVRVAGRCAGGQPGRARRKDRLDRRRDDGSSAR